MRIRPIASGMCVLTILAMATGAAGQSFTADARSIGMGGDGKDVNIASSMVAPVVDYSVIPIPLGLIQVLGNLDAFNPTGDEFDPAWAIEASSNPLHYTFGRKSGSSDDPQPRFIRDLINGELSRDLTNYSGFHLPETISAEGLASPAFGRTIKFARRDSGAFHGVFVGAGPYLSFQTTAGFDPRLVDISKTAISIGTARCAWTTGPPCSWRCRLSSATAAGSSCRAIRRATATASTSRATTAT